MALRRDEKERKKRNPNDATFRNNRAINTRVDTLARRIARLEARFQGIEYKIIVPYVAGTGRQKTARTKR